MSLDFVLSNSVAAPREDSQYLLLIYINVKMREIK